jgi:hypothetical protein
MNKSKIRSNANALVEIILNLTRKGYEVELITNRFYKELILGHKKSLPPEVVLSLRKNSFEYSHLDDITYRDADGNRRCRSYFRSQL